MSVIAGDAVFARLTVRDSGIGIAPADQTRLFQPFNRIERPGDMRAGTGLGLSICKQLADAMKCRIGVVSKLGEGSTFWLEMPLETTAATP